MRQRDREEKRAMANCISCFLFFLLLLLRIKKEIMSQENKTPKRPSAKRSGSTDLAKLAPARKQAKPLNRTQVVDALQSTEIRNEAQFQQEVHARLLKFYTDLEILDTYDMQKRSEQAAGSNTSDGTRDSARKRSPRTA